MDVSYAPRAHVAAWLRKGWRLVPGHDYEPSEWAVVMILPTIPVELTDEQIEAQAARFRRPVAVYVSASSNIERANKLPRSSSWPKGVRRTCAIPGCTQLVNGRGWCNTHYGRWRRSGDPLHLTYPNVSKSRLERFAAKCEQVPA